jgi:hypothetical protein
MIMKEALMNIETHLKKQNRAICKLHRPMVSYYHPELEISPRLNNEETTKYKSYIYILCWMIDLSQFDIYTTSVIISSYLTQP